MSDANVIDQIAAIVGRAEAAAYERGKADAKRELLAFLGAKVPDTIVAPQPAISTDAAASIRAHQRLPPPRASYLPASAKSPPAPGSAGQI